MGDVHIRNVYVEQSGTTPAENPEKYIFFMYREMLLAGNWTEVDKDTDPAWTDSSNIYLSLSDFAVTTANPQRVTSATGGFDSAWEGKLITLFASDDANRGIYNVSKVVNSNTLYVDQRTRPMAWNSDESGITGRIHQCTNGLKFNVAAGFFVVQAPAASGRNLQLHFRHISSQYIYVKAYPNGDYTTTAQATAEYTMDTYDDDIMRFNGFFSDATSSEFHGLIYSFSSNNQDFIISFGELFNVAAGDTNPGYLRYHTGWDHFATEFTMLNEANTATAHYHCQYVWHTSGGYGAVRDRLQYAQRINDGRVKVYKPIVAATNAADGGYIRGNTPRAFANVYAANYTEFNADYWCMTGGVLVPRNGPNDLFPFRSTTA